MTKLIANPTIKGGCICMKCWTELVLSRLLQIYGYADQGLSLFSALILPKNN